jgi:hypothetical protein
MSIGLRWDFFKRRLVFRGFAVMETAVFSANVVPPLYARWLKQDAGIDTAGDGVVDDGILLLLQQLDKLSLGSNIDMNESNLFR